jgi:hypothetical protein
MTLSRAYWPETLELMTTVYELAVKELKLQRAPNRECERLAICILSVGNTYTDTHQLLDKSVRLYLRARDSTFASDMENVLQRRPNSARWLANADLRSGGIARIQSQRPQRDFR